MYISGDDFLKAQALFFAADYLAVEFINECHDRGIGIPDQISVVGFDDNMLARVVRPKLTTIRQENRKKVALAFERLLQVMENKTVENKDTRLSVELVIRDSVRNRSGKILLFCIICIMCTIKYCYNI